MIIGLAGSARSGKDTAAVMLADAHGGVSKRFQVAGPLKAYLRELFDWTVEHTDGALKETPDRRYSTPCIHVFTRYGDTMRCQCGTRLIDLNVPEVMGECTRYLTPRHAMQQLGGEFAEATFPNIYSIRAARLAKEFSDGGEHRLSLITDLRFTRDLEAAKAVGAIIVFIKRDGVGLRGAAALHKGEQAQLKTEFLSLVDHIIDNNGTLDELRAKIQVIPLTSEQT